MANTWYTALTDVVPGALVRSRDINGIDDAINAAFDQLPAKYTGGGGKGFSDPIFIGAGTSPGMAATYGQLVGMVATGTGLGTSTSSVSIATGSKAFVITESTARAWAVGMRVEAISASNPGTKLMQGAVASYAHPDLTITVDTAIGSGAVNDWIIYPTPQISVNTSGDQTIAGTKTFSGVLKVTGSVQNVNSDTFPMLEVGQFRNKVLNPCAEIDSVNRGSAYTTGASSAFQSTIDGWWIAWATGGGVYTAQRIAGGPAGLPYFARFKFTTAATGLSSTGSLYAHCKAYIDDCGIGTTDAVPFTVSFYIRSSVGTGNYAVSLELINIDHTYIHSVAITGTGWQRVSFTPPLLTSTTGTFNGECRVNIMFGAGPSKLGTAGQWNSGALTSAKRGFSGAVNISDTLNAQIDITGVQVERGSSATMLERRPAWLEKIMCRKNAVPIFDGRILAASGVVPIEGRRRGTNQIVLVVPYSGPEMDALGNTACAILWSAPSWVTTLPPSGGNEISGLGLTGNTAITITGALSVSVANMGPHAAFVTLTAATSFSGSSGDAVVLYFGTSAYMYLVTTLI